MLQYNSIIQFIQLLPICLKFRLFFIVALHTMLMNLISLCYQAQGVHSLQCSIQEPVVGFTSQETGFTSKALSPGRGA